MAAANPSRQISDPVWWLWLQFDAFESSALLGGVYADKPGYHNFRANLPSGDYSVGDVGDDRLGPGDKAAAIDLTMSATAMVKYTKRLDAAARAKDPRLYLDGKPILREFIGTKDNNTVYCWVFTGGRSLGVGADAGPDPGRDTSHLWHLHLSFIRRHCGNHQAMNQIMQVLRAAPTSGGVVIKPAPAPPASTEEDFDVPTAQDLLNSDIVPNPAWRPDAKTNEKVRWIWAIARTLDEAHEANVKADRVLALLQTLTGRDMTNEAEIVTGVLQGLSPTAIAAAVAAALPRDLAQQVVSELTAQIAAGKAGDPTTGTPGTAV